MKLYDYIPEALLMQRIEEGYVNQNFHKKFPLAIYTYSKSATCDYVWDEATCKCRGLIVDLRTMEVIADFEVVEIHPLDLAEMLKDVNPAAVRKMTSPFFIFNGKTYHQSLDAPRKGNTIV